MPKVISSLTKLLKMNQLVLGHCLCVCFGYHQYCAATLATLKVFILIKAAQLEKYRMAKKNPGIKNSSQGIDQLFCGPVLKMLWVRSGQTFCAANKIIQVESAKAQNNQIRRHCKFRKTNKIRWFWYIKIFIRLFNFMRSLTLPPSYVVHIHIIYFPCIFKH